MINNNINVKIELESCKLINKSGLKFLLIFKEKELHKILLPKFIFVAKNNEILKLLIDTKADFKQKETFNSIRYRLNNLFTNSNNKTFYKRELILKGLGFKAVVEKPQILTLKVGYSHLLEIEVPKDIFIKIRGNTLNFASTNKQILGNFVNYIKSLKSPDSYKGKGL